AVDRMARGREWMPCRLAMNSTRFAMTARKPRRCADEALRWFDAAGFTVEADDVRALLTAHASAVVGAGLPQPSSTKNGTWVGHSQERINRT
ncbi:MAG: hypothetical protein ACRDS9_24580, partial [Pseudonocardiaceae bacterium]